MKLSDILKNLKGTVMAVVAILSFFVFIFFRSSYVSDIIRDRVEVEMSARFGIIVNSGGYYINPFPLYIAATGISVSHDEGQRLLSAARVKAYVDVVSLFIAKPRMGRLVLERPSFDITPRMIRTVREIGGMSAEDTSVPVKAGASFPWKGVVIIKDAEVAYYSESGAEPDILNGLDMEIFTSDDLEVEFAVKRFDFDIPGDRWPRITPAMRGRVSYKDSNLDIYKFVSRMEGASFTASGRISELGSPGMDGELDLNLQLPVSAIRESFRLSTETSGRLSANGRVHISNTPSATSMSLDIDGDFNLETLLEALRVRPSVRDHFTGRIDCKGTLKGPVNDLQGHADALIEDSVIHRVGIDSATAQVTYDDGRLHIGQGKARAFGGEADVDVGFSVLRKEPFSVNVEFRDADSTLAFRRIGVDRFGLPEGKVSGRISSEGMRFSPEGWARFKGGVRKDTPLGRVGYLYGNFHTIDGILFLEDFNLRAFNSHSAFNGHIDLTGNDIGFDGYVVSTQLNELISPFDHGFNGGGRLSVRVTGTKDDPLVHASASLWDASFRNYTFGATTMEFAYSKKLLDIASISAGGNRDSYNLGGRIVFDGAKHLFDLKTPRFELDADARNASLGGLVSIFVNIVALSGDVDTALELRGTPGALDLSGLAQVSNVASYGRTIDNGEVAYYLKGDHLGISSSILHRGDGWLDFRGDFDLKGNYEVNVRSGMLWLSHLIPKHHGPDYKMDMLLSGSGSLSEPLLDLRASLSDGVFKGAYVGGGTLNASLGKSIINASIELVDGKLAGEGRLDLNGAMPWELGLDLGYDRYDFLLRSFFPSTPDDIVLAMDGRVNLWGNKSRANADLRLKRANITLYRQGYANIGPFEMDIRGRKLVFRHVNMRGAHAAFSLGGSMVMSERYDLDIDLNASLLPLARFVPGVARMKGDSISRISLRGEWDNPSIEGRLTLSEGSVALRDMPQRVTDIDASVLVGGGKATIERASASVGGGTIELGGSLSHEGFRITDMNMEADIREVSTRFSSRFNSTLEGALHLIGDGERRILGGEIHIKQANYRQRVEWKKWILARKAESSKEPSKWKSSTDLNVRLYGEDDIRVENNLANASLRLDLYVKGTLADPAFSGRFEAKGGKVFFRNSELNIVSAIADYAGPGDRLPLVGITASAFIDGYDIWLRMEGKANQMDLQLSSDPPLEDNEILLLLTYGGLASGDELAGTGLGAAEATYLLTGEIQDLMEERLTMFTGLDRVQIDPYVSRTTGSVTPRLMVAKKLQGEKLYVTYASTLDAVSEEEIKLEYLLGENVSIVGGQDYTGSIGGDLKFRFRFE